MSDWTKFATNYYNEQKVKNPDYKFKNALKDASPLFKKSKSSDDKESMAIKKKGHQSKKSKKGTRGKKSNKGTRGKK